MFGDILGQLIMVNLLASDWIFDIGFTVGTNREFSVNGLASELFINTLERIV